MEEAVLDLLNLYGYSGPEAKVFLQSFEADALKTLRFDLGTELPLVQLISGSFAYFQMWTESGLDEIATYANAIGPSKAIIETNPDFVQWAHARGLAVHPYTFRLDDVPSAYASLEDELRTFYFDYDVDGLFTDFVDVATQVLSEAR